MRRHARLEGAGRRDGKGHAAHGQQDSQASQRAPWLVAITDRDVLYAAPEPGERRLGGDLRSLARVQDGARLRLLADRVVMPGELSVRLRLVTIRITGQPGQPLASGEPGFECPVGQAIEAERSWPAARIIADEVDVSVPEVHQALDRLSRSQRQLRGMQPSGIDRRSTRVADTRVHEVKLGTDGGLDHPQAAGRGHSGAEHIGSDPGPRHGQGYRAGILQPRGGQNRALTDLDAAQADLAGRVYPGQDEFAADRRSLGGQGYLAGGAVQPGVAQVQIALEPHVRQLHRT
jgi:hypothetical protein